MFNLIVYRAAKFPRWRGLTHFGNVMSMSFTDGSKYEDLSKVTRPPTLFGCTDSTL